jgi:hypothetical protein
MQVERRGEERRGEETDGGRRNEREMPKGRVGRPHPTRSGSPGCLSLSFLIQIRTGPIGHRSIHSNPNHPSSSSSLPPPPAAGGSSSDLVVVVLNSIKFKIPPVLADCCIGLLACRPAVVALY